MVVGIRQTSSAIRAVMLTTVPVPAACTLNIENGSSVTVTTKNTMVSATSKIVSAISLGVFWRLAPSTMLIMRSRNDSPGFTLMRTTSQSDSTRVPPVTLEKSPPDSRTTGADSPVMALSSTEATPSMTSPSSGTRSFAMTSTTSPLRRFSASSGNHVVPYLGSRSFLAMVLFFRLRSEEACAWARPSARASAKLANSTVNHSHTATDSTKPAVPSPLSKASTPNSVVRMLPIKTTNITGLCHCTRGLSLVKAAASAGLSRAGSSNTRDLGVFIQTSFENLSQIGL